MFIHRHAIATFTAASFLGCLLTATAQDAPAPLKDRPITTAQGKVGDLLRQWWKEGTAAGNVGDWYDNRDGAHSDLNLGPYPQLQRIIYTDEQIKQKKHWAARQVGFGSGDRRLLPCAAADRARFAPGIQPQ